MLQIRVGRLKLQLLTCCIFHVQVTEAPESEVNLRAEETFPAAGRKSTDGNSAKLGEWEMLMDAKPIPNLGERHAFICLSVPPGVKKMEVFPPLPAGIQAAVRMLEHKLRNLNVYEDSKPEVDYVSKAHTRRENGVLSDVGTCLIHAPECCKTTGKWDNVLCAA